MEKIIQHESFIIGSTNMTRLQLIQTEIETLTNDEFICLKNWINELDAQQGESQIEEDSSSGRLDFLIEESLLGKVKVS
jgi:hypothetical protein